ncbi:serpin B6 [Galendromus occidentalis]|uniref:Serpin B6 n=1 Tax=Galendromus occidentalis TaxID=34638 RepID=A0AAJ6QUU5_9ACAR|nr:serpin B6 [Galendromus occidentalis]
MMKAIPLMQFCFIVSVSSQQIQNDGEIKLWNALGNFGHKLSQKLASSEPRGNILVSPLSVATALNMALVGAGGSTKGEMITSMGLQGIDELSLRRAFLSILSRKHDNPTDPVDPNPRTSFTLLAANRLYISSRFPTRNEFKTDIAENFLAEALNVDFLKNGSQIQNEINAFVSERTRGLIKDVLKQPLSPSTMLALINTVYFKGFWTHRMDEVPGSWIFNEGCAELQSQPEKRLMVTSRYKYLDSANLQAQMILLPYVSDDTVVEMLIMLPHEEHKCNTQAWFERISGEALRSEIRNMSHTRVHLTMPAFELDGRYDLERVLPTMGMPSAFTPGQADFTGISSQRTNIDKVIHQSKMIVTRFGTEAAAATVLAITRFASFPSVEPIPMVVDRSFYVSIIYRVNRDSETFLPLFTGLVHRI